MMHIGRYENRHALTDCEFFIAQHELALAADNVVDLVSVRMDVRVRLVAGM